MSVQLFITKILILDLQSAKELNSLSVILQNTEQYEISTPPWVNFLQKARLRHTYCSEKFTM
jgi:hypothetical protein